MRRWIGVAFIIGGVAIMVLPYRHEVRFPGEGDGLLRARAQCLPIRDAFKKVPDGGWFGYAPGTHIAYLDSRFCSPTARRRLGFGAIALVAGGVILARDQRRR